MKIWEKHFNFNFDAKLYGWLILSVLPLGMGMTADASDVPAFEQADALEDYYYELEDWGDSDVSLDDPFESINRFVFQLNDVLFESVFDPIQAVYEKVTTLGLRQSFKNFFHNLEFPIRFFSNALQFKYEQVYYESLKFGLNTTVGFFGFAKPSEKFEFLRQIPEEDFGQVLAFWGVPEGPYLVVPLIGPSSLRDLPTKFFEPVINPLEVPVGLWDDIDWQWLMSFTALEVLVLNSERAPAYKSLKMNSIDPYLALRSSYWQIRHKAYKE